MAYREVFLEEAVKEGPKKLPPSSGGTSRRERLERAVIETAYRLAYWRFIERRL